MSWTPGSWTFDAPIRTSDDEWGCPFCDRTFTAPEPYLRALTLYHARSHSAACTGPPGPVGRPTTTPDDVRERIVARYQAGGSLSAIAREMNAAGVPTAQGGARWWASTVRAVLLRTQP